MKEYYKELLEKAKSMTEFSYAPYSKFMVGASILYESGNVYGGCNNADVTGDSKVKIGKKNVGD